jgi:hypothetical protein
VATKAEAQVSEAKERRGERTEHQQRVRERTEDGEEEAADEAGAHDLKQQLAPRRQARGRPEHEEAVREHQDPLTDGSKLNPTFSTAEAPTL